MKRLRLTYTEPNSDDSEVEAASEPLCCNTLRPPGKLYANVPGAPQFFSCFYIQRLLQNKYFTILRRATYRGKSLSKFDSKMVF
jgi:hypothetical protein